MTANVGVYLYDLPDGLDMTYVAERLSEHFRLLPNYTGRWDFWATIEYGKRVVRGWFQLPDVDDLEAASEGAASLLRMAWGWSLGNPVPPMYGRFAVDCGSLPSSDGGGES